MNLYFSFAAVLIVCLFAGRLCEKIRMPALLGYMITGFLLGPYVLNLAGEEFLSLSSFLRKFALIIILARAGLSLNLGSIRKNGLGSLLLCFVPACFEIGAYMLLAGLTGLSLLDAAILGCVMSAVSPAVIVPRMISIEKKGYGKKSGICQMILAGASMDDIFVITVFTALLACASSGEISWNVLWQFPVSILLGLAAGLFFGKAAAKISGLFSLSKTQLLILLCSLSFLMVWFEDAFSAIPFASLLAVLSMHYGIKDKRKEVSPGYDSLWTFGQMLLFAMIGMMVDPALFAASFGMIILVMTLALLVRMAGVYVSLLFTKLEWKTKLFAMIAYLPKATVQAGIGALPLAAGLASGNLILSFAAAAIVITAPVGACLIDFLYPVLLEKE